MQSSTLIKRLFGIQDFYLIDLKIFKRRVEVVLDRAKQQGEYDRRWCWVRDFNFGDKEIWIKFPKIRYLAQGGWIRNEQLPWVGHYGRLTRRFERHIPSRH
ncbi:MAG TPA: hypothetical protein VJL87_00835 [Bdellovibrionota bacterium]|nr:hypothetical protein [Bdellovibrionota bacterium]